MRPPSHWYKKQKKIPQKRNLQANVTVERRCKNPQKKILAICIQQYNKKSYRKGEISYDIPYILNLKRNDTDELTKQKETHRLRKQANGCWEERIVKDFGKVMYTLLYLKSITNQNLLHELCSKLHVSLDVKEGWGRIDRYMYMYGWVPLLYTWDYHNVVNQLYPNTKCFWC